MINRSMDLTSDDELLRQARHFDLPALSAIYDRYNNGLYYYALRLLSDTVIAEDCVAETFSHLLKVLKSGGGPRDNLKGYLYRCVHNWVTDYYRRKPTLLSIYTANYLTPKIVPASKPSNISPVSAYEQH